MALALGLENKRKVALAIGLFAVLIGVVVWFFSGPPAPPPPAAAAPTQTATPAQTEALNGAATPDKPPAVGGEAQKLSNVGIDPALHFDKLAASEDVHYEGTGRNIFSPESAPIAIPQPLAPGRPGSKGGGAVALAPAAPRPPDIDLKYFGYEQDKDKSLRAFFVHGDDIFIARTGEIVDHRYKVGAIHPLNVEVTDLSYNNTQTLALSSF